MQYVYPFNHEPVPPISEVGGKAHSLIMMTHAGLTVPNGFVCGADFFSDWTDQVEASKEWGQLQSAIAEGQPLTAHTAAIKTFIQTLQLSDAQEEAVNDSLKALKEGSLYAVRSSSPEEDLAGSSFAGIYETVLGVEKQGIKDAVLQVFLSAFDERVFVYKKAKGFLLGKVKIAVAVMEQINSDTAGVGFSVNPINNDYDEATINANYGLGESVVSGLVSPDYFVVNKVDGTLVSKTLGNKQKSVYLSDGPDGGTHEKTNPKADEFCLTDAQIVEIAKMIAAVEKLYGLPMDIEWAYHAGVLYMIQARPITTHIPLPPDMLTAPGDKKRTLYYDCSVLEGVTTNKPITTMTMDWTLNSLGNAMLSPYTGEVALSADGDPKTEVFFGKGVRIYMNFSQLFFLEKPKQLAKEAGALDQGFADSLAHLDLDLYLPATKFPTMKWSFIVPFMFRSAFRARTALLDWIEEAVNPVKFHNNKYKPKADAIIAELKALHETADSLDDYLQTSGKLLEEYSLLFMPLVLTYIKNVNAIDEMFKDTTGEIKMLGDKLTLGIQGDEAIGLGISLYELSKLLPKEEFADLNALAEKCRQRQLPDAFMKAWDAFVAEHGTRGPNEMELANSRYGDDPTLAFEQMSTMLHSEENPADILQQHVTGRQQAYEELQQKLSAHESKKLRQHYELVNALSSVRDTLKYVLVQINFTVRKLALQTGEGFAKAGRLDAAGDIFFLEFAEIDSANEDSGFDLKGLVGTRKPAFEAAVESGKPFPVLIDSRGRIPTYHKPEAKQAQDSDPNVLHGSGISRGVARGRVKVLKDPREKPINKGDILVAYLTDPGWTPLFIGATGIILEVGAVLQHGGVVAREYGKPCVAGIAGITEKLRDGQLVEVDGTNGTVTLLPDDSQ